MKRITGVLIFLSLFTFSASAQLMRNSQSVIPVPIPDSLYFAGERVPLENQDIRERLERELMHSCYRHYSTLLILKRENRWRKVMDDALKAEGIPTDFFYLAVAESDLNGYAESNRAATGMWQFMEPTGKEWGLTITPYIDERQDPILSSKAASKYLKFLYKRFDSWTAAAAAFNRGHGGLERAFKAQQVKSYYDLYLNEQTYRYVFRVLALKLIIENPKDYGFCVEKYEKYEPFVFEELKVTQTIDSLPAFARKHKTTYKILKILNPWLDLDIKYKLVVPKNESFTLRMPTK
jgi:hypothetical protein